MRKPLGPRKRNPSPKGFEQRGVLRSHITGILRDGSQVNLVVQQRHQSPKLLSSFHSEDHHISDLSSKLVFPRSQGG